MIRYEKMNIVQTKEQAENIVSNLRDNGIKAYYYCGWVVMREISE